MITSGGNLKIPSRISFGNNFVKTNWSECKNQLRSYVWDQVFGQSIGSLVGWKVFSELRDRVKGQTQDVYWWHIKENLNED